MDLELIERPSPNFDERQLPVSMIVLHYTGMADAESAIAATLQNPFSRFEQAGVMPVHQDRNLVGFHGHLRGVNVRDIRTVLLLTP